MKLLKRAGLFVVLLLLLLLVFIAYLTMTHGGMQRLFSLGQSYVDGELTFAESSGSLSGPLSLKDVLYVNESGMSASVDSVLFDWKPRRLWRRTVALNELDLQGITVHLPPASPEEKASEPFQLRDLSLPVNVDLQSLRIADLQVIPHGAEQPLVIDEITLKAVGEDSSLRLVDLQVQAPEFEFSLDGMLDTRGDWPMKLNPKWTYNHTRFGRFTGDGTITGDTQLLKIQHRVDGPVQVELIADVNDVTAEVSWQGNAKVTSGDLGAFTDAMSGVPLSVNAMSNGSLSGYLVSGKAEIDHPLSGETYTDFALKGDMNHLVVDRAVVTLKDSPGTAELSGRLDFAEADSDFELQWSQIRWPLLDSDPMVAMSPQGKFSIDGSADQLKINGTTQVTGVGEGTIDVQVDVAGGADAISINSIKLSSEDSDINALARGTVDLLNESVDLSATIDRLVWPLNVAENESTIHISDGEVVVKGPLSGYQVNTELALQGKNIPEGSWKLTGLGNSQRVENIKLNGNTLDGSIKGTGTLAWNPAVQWDFNLAAREINPAQKWPDLNGDINVNLLSTGVIGEQGLRAENRISDLNGTYRGQALNGGGDILINDGRVQIDQLNIQAGDASVTAGGSIGETADVNWRVDAPILEKLLPGISGNIDIKGRLTGNMATPATDVTISADNLITDSVQVKSIRGAGNIDLSGGRQSTVDLQLRTVVAADQQFDTIRVNGNGTPAQHSATAQVESALGNLTLNANGALSEGTWRGVMDKLDVTDTDVGDWNLQAPVNIEASASAVVARSLCMTSNPATACVDGKWSSNNGVDAKLNLDSLDTARLKNYMPPDVTLDSLLSGKATFKAQPNKPPAVTAELDIPGGELRYLDSGEPRTANLGSNTINFSLANDNLNSVVDLDLGEIGTIAADTKIGELSTTKKLGGSVKTDLKDIAIFSSFAPGMDSFDGTLNTEMQLAGTVDKPQIRGDSELDALVLEVPSVAMKLIDGKIIARSDGKGGLALSGQAQSGDGAIELDGRFNPATNQLEMTIKGENFRVANAGNQRAEISPDLRVTMDGDDIAVTGVVHIPTAFIDAGAGAGLVKESSDVVIVNDGEVNAEVKDESNVEVDVRVTLGDDIRVKAGQFNGALAGELSVEQLPGGVPTGVGTIEVVNGDFLVYGQKLIMEKGRILFGGGPVANPALELDVAREIPAYEVKAGAKIRGTAQAPLLELQSNPPQTDANTLSYILLGQPVGTAGASYTLGKYITPDLYVSYGIDLFDKVQTFNLRYRITDRLSLLATQSENSSADLLYTFER